MVLLGKKPTDYILGNQITAEPLVEDWAYYLDSPDYKLEHEHQKPFGYETASCTVFSGNDVKELLFTYAIDKGLIDPQDIVWLRQNGYFRNKYINFDDRVPAMFAEIKENVGTYQFIAGQALRKWSLPEGILTDKPKNFKEYVDQAKLTKEAIRLQVEFESRFIWNWFWFNDSEPVAEQLKFSPSMAVVSFSNGSGCLTPKTPFNHAVCEYGVNENGCSLINDSYEQQFKKYHKDYIKSRLGFRLTILGKNIMELNIEDNKLYLLVEGQEQRLAMGLGDKLWVYDRAIDTLLNSASRSKAYQIPQPITAEQWNKAKKVNGKGEELN